MTTDLWMLVLTGLLAALLPMVYAAGRFQVPGGFHWAFGNRDTPFEVAPWVSRTVRAHQNLVENIGPFAILVLVAQVSGKANAATALGAMIFFYARIAHVLFYTGGLIYWRTAAFFVAVAGELVILAQLFH
jgi:uncharacterized MAPEG superfamily protein